MSIYFWQYYQRILRDAACAKIFCPFKTGYRVAYTSPPVQKHPHLFHSKLSQKKEAFYNYADGFYGSFLQFLIKLKNSMRM